LPKETTATESPNWASNLEPCDYQVDALAVCYCLPAKVLLADTNGVSQEVLKDVATFYEFVYDNVKAEVRVFANLVEEIEKEDESAGSLEQDDKRYKTLSKR